jgi:hypothetical protein
MTHPETEERLRRSLGVLAEAVRPDDGAYRRVQAIWRRRERRRRLLMVVLAVVIIAVADALGLWLLNRVAAGDPVIFQGPAPAGAVVPHPPR